MAPIREPDKNPTPYEQATMTAEAYPHLVLAIQQIESGACDVPTDIDDDNDVQITVFKARVKEEVLGYIDSSPVRLNTVLLDSSDVESDAGSIDSICANADFVHLGSL